MKGLELNHKSTILILRWLTVLTVILLMLYSQRGLVFGTKAYLLGIAFLLSNIVLAFIPREYFSKLALSSIIVSMDAGFVSLAIYLTSGFNTDFYLVYFLVIFIAAMRQDLKGSIMAGVIAAHLVYELDEKGKQLRVVKYTDYTAEIIRTLYPTAAVLREHWARPDDRDEIMAMLADRGININKLEVSCNVNIFIDSLRGFQADRISQIA